MTFDSSYSIINARLPNQGDHYYKIDLEKGVITRIQQQDQTRLEDDRHTVINFNGDWLSLGGIDLQINGALGVPFPELVPRQIEKLFTIAQFLWEQGVDGFLPTIVTSSPEKVARSLQTISDYIQQYQTQDFPYARILGVHLEGPFLNPKKRGAHPEKYLLDFTLDNFERLIGKYSEQVRVVTCAPEISSDEKIIAELRSRFHGRTAWGLFRD